MRAKLTRKIRCYYFSEGGHSWFEADESTSTMWHEFSRKLGRTPTRQEYEQFINKV